MSLRLNCSQETLQPSTFLHRNFRSWKHRRLKLNRKNFPVRNHFGPLISLSSEPFFQNLISQFPSVNSLDLIVPVLGFASGIALFFSNLKKITGSVISDVGEWMLFASPTPFNRFVLLRCPSMSFEGGGEVLQDVNDKLVKEDRHFVTAKSGRIHSWDWGDGDSVDKLIYQRVCVGADDGGVISLDWPANLDLKEHGLDTTLLLVPGTAEGSMDTNVRFFVCESLKNGCFPIVMNPRGCAGSPLTTSRLFTAADSDDIWTAIQFINRSRPWTTFMSVGWGYGANMLTKYLGEVAERTPLTAAACIDNPFDLEEATRSFPHHIAVDEKLMGGLVDILRANKELFQGRTKGFDVAKALSATSVREFEKAISMVSYGFEAIEDFYSKSSTREMVGSVKIPVLFIQSGDGTVPFISIPRSSIAENPFTSLLLWSCLPPRITSSERSAIPWCQHLAIEWLSAVELALLKGRHPLLKDVDITISPSNGLALVEGRELNKRISTRDETGGSYYHAHSHVKEKNEHVDHFLNLTQTDATNGFHVDSIRNTLEKSDNVVQNNGSIHLKSGSDFQRKQSLEGVESQQGENTEDFQYNNSVDTGLVGGGDNSLDIERTQVLQTAEVVIHMLDTTMPGTLADEQKKKVLTAVGQGETLMKALQGAVPEDVRGKLTAAVSEIVQTQGMDFSIDKLMKMGWIPNVTSEVKSKIQEKLGEISSAKGGTNSTQYNSGLTRRVDGATGKSSQEEISKDSDSQMPDDLSYLSAGVELRNDINDKESGSEKPDMLSGSEILSSPKFKESVDLSDSQLESNYESDMLTSGMMGAIETQQNRENIEFSQEKSFQSSEYAEPASETGNMPNHYDKTEKPSGNEEAVGEHFNVSHRNAIADSPHTFDQAIIKEASDREIIEEDSLDAATDQTKVVLSTKHEETFSSSSEAPLMEKVGNDIKKIDDNNMQALANQNMQSYTNSEEPILTPSLASDPSITVSQALDALTGFDNSTQMAVSSVFGVIENMIDKLEENDQRDGRKQNQNEVEESGASSEEVPVSREFKSEKEEDSKNELILQSDVMQLFDHPVNNFSDECAESLDNEGNKWDRKNLHQDLSSSSKNSLIRSHGNTVNIRQSYVLANDSVKQDLTGSANSAENSNNITHVHNCPVQLTIPYRDSPYKEYLGKFLISKMSKTKSLDLASTNSLFLEYFPEEGQWKLLDQMGNTSDSMDNSEAHNSVNGNCQSIHSPFHVSGAEKFIEPSYVILDTELGRQSREEYETRNGFNEKDALDTSRLAELSCLVKNIILDSLKVEVGRKLAMSDMEEMESNLAYDLEKVAVAVSQSVRSNKHLISSLESQNPGLTKFGTLSGEDIIKTISSAVQDADHLRKVLPVGVIVGSTLAALRQYFNVATLYDYGQKEPTFDQAGNLGEILYGQESDRENYNRRIVGKEDQYADFDSLQSRTTEKPEAVTLNNNNVMVGAVTAVLGASALLANHQSKCYEAPEVPSGSLIEKRYSHKEHDKLEEEERNEHNLVSSLAEKAMSVAAPVVPTTSDGEVDQDRLVAMLAELGQKGGMLRLIGKIALLWGGIRGAVSLTDRLISFLRLAERPLYQRILGFVCMVLVLWSPVVVPLFPTLVQNWTIWNSTGIAGYACIIGLYTAVTILVMRWGKRIRKYENPIEHYGLDLTTSSKLYDFLKGLMGGVMLILSIHLIHTLLGYASLAWPSVLPLSSADAIRLLKVYGRILMLVTRGIVTAIGVAVVEELLFRSWLPEEIAVDLGYHRAIIISGIAFSLFQRHLPAIPGLWMLSLALSGAKQRSGGNLSVPIGMHAGILITNYILQTSGFLTYLSDVPLWIVGTLPLHPFGGATGLTILAVLALVLYPRQPI